MRSKTVGSHTRIASALGTYQNNLLPSSRAQRGFTLIELMVGIAIGLLVVAVAMGALMVSRGISGTVSDASNIQQQGAYAMRVMGQQLRQAGSLRLNLNPGTSTVADLYLAPVGLEISAVDPSDPAFNFNAKNAVQIVSGAMTPETLTVGYQRYEEAVFIDAAARSQTRNCVGGPDDTTTTQQRIESGFQLVGSELRCSGNGQPAQPMVQNVANFQVRYILQDNTSTPGIPTIKAVDASGVANWAQVQAVEVCLALYGNEVINLPAGSTYTDCDGATNIDMSTLPADTATVKRRNRMHLVFRNVFQLRSQGLIGSVLP